MMFDEYADGTAMRASGLIQEVRNSARGEKEKEGMNNVIIILSYYLSLLEYS